MRSKSRKGSNKFDFNISKFRNLFGIVACKHVNFNSCTCIKKKKIVPHMEQEFLNYQRSKRKMSIDN